MHFGSTADGERPAVAGTETQLQEDSCGVMFVHPAKSTQVRELGEQVATSPGLHEQP